MDLYVQNMEEEPDKIIDLIMQFYQEKSVYKNKTEYQSFQRYQNKIDVSTLPWFNKEIFIKLYKKLEGRDFDNRHPYPYVSIQVRYDRDLKELVVFSENQAENGYLHW